MCIRDSNRAYWSVIQFHYIKVSSEHSDVSFFVVLLMSGLRLLPYVAAVIIQILLITLNISVLWFVIWKIVQLPSFARGWPSSIILPQNGNTSHNHKNWTIPFASLTDEVKRVAVFIIRYTHNNCYFWSLKSCLIKFEIAQLIPTRYDYVKLETIRASNVQIVVMLINDPSS